MQKDTFTSLVLDTTETSASVPVHSLVLDKSSSNKYPTEAQVAAAIANSDNERRGGCRVPNIDSAGFHEHPDCIRIAMQWLDAQQRRAGRMNICVPVKHLIEQWAGRYISQDDVEVAARLLGYAGKYPRFAISNRLIYPDLRRLDGIDEAFTQPGYCRGLIGIGTEILGVGTIGDGVYRKAESGASLHDAYVATLRRASLYGEAVLHISRRVSP